MGGAAFTDAFRALRPEGRLLCIGFASGEVPQIAANQLLVKNIDMIGLNLGGYLRFNPGALRDSIGQVLDWASAGKLAPHGSHRFELQDAAEALEVLRQRRSTGKIIVTP